MNCIRTSILSTVISLALICSAGSTLYSDRITIQIRIIIVFRLASLLGQFHVSVISQHEINTKQVFAAKIPPGGVAPGIVGIVLICV